MQSAITTRPRISDGAIPGGYRHTGSPTLYRPEYAADIVTFFASKPVPVTPPEGGAKEAVQFIYATMPTFEEFAGLIEVSTNILREWENRHTAFQVACARARDIQRRWFTAGLASGAMNPTGGIFVAKNIIGWRDRTEVETVTRVEDSESTQAMKLALHHATPDQLAALSTLVRAMMANAPASIE
tara:strand:+ start:836 stop:1390 length:555 start_codon:yes stop_codon:yes gene_type:complete